MMNVSHTITESYHQLFKESNDLDKSKIFLPTKIPGCDLPRSFNTYYDAIKHIPTRLTGNTQGVRLFLTECLKDINHTKVLEDIDSLDENQLYEALTILTILMQSYRWDILPATSETYSLEELCFPERLYKPWVKVSNKLRLPHSNTYWSIIATNWCLKQKCSGDQYKNSELTTDNLRILYSWLPSPYSSQLEEFILSFVEMEAYGVNAIRSILKIINLVFIQDHLAVHNELLKLNAAIKSMSLAFNRRIRKNKIDPTIWREIIHVPFAWGLKDASGQKLEGASGMQLGAIAVLNAFFSIPESSFIGKATRTSRKYLLPEQRDFLFHIDQCANIVNSYFHECSDMDVIALHNDCISNIISWRVSHQKRGAMYLSSGNKNNKPQIATGLTLSGEETDLSSIYVKDMEERIKETKLALLEC